MARKSAARKAEAPAAEPDRRVGAVTELMEYAGAANRPALRLESGREIVVEEGATDLVTIVGPEGGVELSVRFTATGPVLNFDAAAIRMTTPGRLDLDCGKLDIRSEHGIDLHAGGNMTQTVDGHHTLRATGRSVTDAYAVEVRSQRGDVKVKANDNVRIDGEKVLMNC